MTTITLLGTMLLAMGIMVFGASYKNYRVFFENQVMSRYAHYRSEAFTVNQAGTYPAYVGWKNVTSEGLFTNTTYQVEKFLFITGDHLYNEKVGTIKSTTSGQSFQTVLPVGKMKVDIMGQGSATAILTGYSLYWN